MATDRHWAAQNDASPAPAQIDEFEMEEVENSSANLVDPQSQAAFLLNMSQRLHLSDTSLRFVIQSTKQLFGDYFSALQRKIATVVPDGEKDEILESCQNLFDSEGLFSGLENRAALEKFYENLGLFVRPRAVRLGFRRKKVLRQGTRMFIDKSALGYFVPFEAKLISVLKMPEVQMQRTSILRDNRRMFSFLDGNYFRTSTFLHDHPDALVFLLPYSLE